MPKNKVPDIVANGRTQKASLDPGTSHRIPHIHRHPLYS